VSRSEHEATKQYQMYRDTFNVTNPVVLYNSTRSSRLPPTQLYLYS